MPGWRPPNNCPFVSRTKAKRRREKSTNIRLKPEKLSLLNKIIRNYQPKSCLFCDSSADDENLCGDLRFYEPLKLSVHYFCLLFSPNLIQNHNDSYGLAGFRILKVIDEIIFAQEKICVYCSKPGANARCLHRENSANCKQETAQFCKNVFHVSCGRTNKALMQFFGAFKTYCHEHYIIPKGPWELQRSGRMRFYGYGMVRCGICTLYVKSRADLNVFRSFCCKFAYFHGECTQKLALSAGSYALRCPLCNNSQDFQNYLLDRGVYIPIRDSMWEIDGENRYASLYERPKICSYENCRAKIFTDEDESQNQILYCILCGSQAVHKRCVENFTLKIKKAKTRRSIEEWKCPACEDFDKRSKPASEMASTSTPIPEAKKPPKKRKSKNLKRKNFQTDSSACTSIRAVQSTTETIIDLDDSAENLDFCAVKPPKKCRKKKNSKAFKAAVEHSTTTRRKTPETTTSKTSTATTMPKTSTVTTTPEKKTATTTPKKKTAATTPKTKTPATTTPKTTTAPSTSAAGRRPLVPPGFVYAAPSPPTIDDGDDDDDDSFWNFLRPPGQTMRLPLNVEPIVSITDCACIEIQASPNSTSAIVNGGREKN